MLTGTIKYFDPRGGGFIHRPGGSDIFVYVRDLATKPRPVDFSAV